MPEAGIFYANESGTAEVQAFVSFSKETKAFLLPEKQKSAKIAKNRRNIP